MTKEQLRQYIALGIEIDLLNQEIQRLRASLQAVPKMDDMPHGNLRSDRMVDTIAKIVDLTEIIREKTRRCIELRQDIEEAIDGLPPDLRVLMRMRYIEGMRWEKVTVQLNYSWRQTHRLHGYALQKMAHNGT